MATSRETVVSASEHIAKLNPDADFAYRVSWVEQLADIDDPQRRMAAYCIITAGVAAPAEYEVQLARHDVVERAKETKQLIVAGKIDAGFNRTMLHAAIPQGSMFHRATIHEYLEPHQIQTIATIPTFRSSYAEDRLAHAFTHILEEDEEVIPYEERAVKELLKTGEIGTLRALGHPSDGSIWFESWVSFNEDGTLKEEREQRTDPLHAVLDLDSYIKAVTENSHMPADQIRLVGLLARVLAQAETGELYIDESDFIKESQTRKAGSKQFRNGNISAAVAQDLQILVARAKEITPKTPAQAQKERDEENAKYWAEREQAEREAAEAKQLQIQEKLKSLEVMFTEPYIETEEEDKANLPSLEELYERAETEGYFVYEFQFGEEYSAAVGDISRLKKLGLTVEDQLDLGILMNVSSPGSGETRELAVHRAFTGWHLHKMENKEDPGSKSLYVTVKDGDRVAKVLIPDHESQAQEATIQIFEKDAEEPSATLTVRMDHAPIFGVDADDRDAILQEVVQYFLKSE